MVIIVEDTKVGYDYLREMCSFNADFTARTPKINPLTNRHKYVIHQLEQMGLNNYEVDYFDSENPYTLHIGRTKLANIVVKFKGKTDETVVFLAHIDVSNKESENCQDNTASVCNLLDLCQRLKGKELDKNVVVCFTDAEEIVSPRTCGSKRLSIRINNGDFGNVLYATNLELTANGKNIWATRSDANSLLLKKVRETLPNIKQVSTPYQDSVVLGMNGIDSICFGILTDSEMNDVLKRGYCSTWALCHCEADTFNKAIEGDMSAFVDFLETLI